MIIITDVCQQRFIREIANDRRLSLALSILLLLLLLLLLFVDMHFSFVRKKFVDLNNKFTT